MSRARSAALSSQRAWATRPARASRRPSWGSPPTRRASPPTGCPAASSRRGRSATSSPGRPTSSSRRHRTNPDFVQLYRQGEPAYFPRNGNALTSAAIVSAGSIGRTTLVGNTSSSEIKAGLEGTRAPSRIAPIEQRGDSINSAVSAPYRPYQHLYGTFLDTAGPGQLKGALYHTGGVTALGNQGSGFFARHKVGYLPPPQAPKRGHGVLVR